MLAAAPKPLIVAPLLEPGWIAFWNATELEPRAVEILEREFANQRAYFAEKLEQLHLRDDDCVETPDGEFQLPVSDFRRWANEYTVSVGVGMCQSPRANSGRILLRPPGGGGPPVGRVDS